MKKFYSFALACFTILVLMIATIPEIKKNINTSYEYQKGYEIVYKVSKADGSDAKVSENEIKNAAKLMEKRLAYHHHENAKVTYEDNDYLRINLAGQSYADLTHVLEHIDINQVATIGNSKNNDFYLFEEVFTSKIVYYYDQLSYGMTLDVKDQEKLDLVRSLDDNNSFIITIWDNYYNEDEKAVADTLSSIVFDEDGVNVTYASSDNHKMSDDGFVLSFGNLKVNIAQHSIVKTSATFPSYVIVAFFIFTLFTVAAVMYLLSKFFKLNGILGSILLFFTTFFTIICFHLMNGAYNLVTCFAILLSIGVAVDLFVGISAKIKAEIYKGRSLTTAFNEGYTKSLGLIIDTLLIYLIVGMVCYFAGNSEIKNLAFMLLSGFAANFIFVALGYFLSGSLLLKTPFVKNKNVFNVNEEKIINVEKGETTTYTDKVETSGLKKYFKWSIPAFLIIILVGGCLFTGLTLGKQSGFNYSHEFKNGSVVRITVDNDKLDTKEEVLTVLKDHGIKLDYDTLRFIPSTIETEEGIETKYVFVAYSEDKSLNKDEAKIVEAIKSVIGDDDYKEEMVSVGVIKTVNNDKKVLNSVKTFGIILLATFIYFLVRYRLSMVLATFATLIMTSLTYLALLALLRFSFDYNTILFGFILVTGLILYNVYLYDRAKEVIKQGLAKSKEEIENEVIGAILPRAILSFDVSFIFTLLYISAAPSKYIGVALVTILVPTLVIYATLFVSFKIWIKIDNKVKPIKFDKVKKIKKFKPKAIEGEPKEYIFTGIND